MGIDGKWWFVHAGVDFDRDAAGSLDFVDGQVMRDGEPYGRYTIAGRKVVLHRSAAPGEPWVFACAPEWTGLTGDADQLGDLDGETYLWKDGDWVDAITAQNRERAGRYSTIDTSMYPHDAPGRDELRNAETVEEIEAALAKLPLATFTHAEPA